MPNLSLRQVVCRVTRPLILTLAVLPLLASAQKVISSFSGPSLVAKAKGAEFTGRGFVPNAAVSISIRSPDGSEAHYSAVVAADGQLLYRVLPKSVGNHIVTVLDSSGKALSTTKFQAIQ
jgi:hypothetical protein